MSTRTIESINKGLDEAYKLPADGTIPDWIINEAYLLNDALDKKIITPDQLQAGRDEGGALFEDSAILEVMRGLASPKMFVELPWENLQGEMRGNALQSLFRQEMTNEDGVAMELGDYLAENGMSLSISMSTLDDETAEAFKYLNEKGVPIVAWVVVEDAEGYWTNAANIPETTLKTEAILSWAEQHNIKLHAVGFDLEKPLQLLSALAQLDIVGMAKEYAKYKRKERRQGYPENELKELIEQVKKRGLQTEAYVFPRPLGPILGGIEAPNVDTTVEMLYLKPPFPGLLRNRNTVPAFGIAARPKLEGMEDERPGRDFYAINQVSKGKKLEDIERKPVGEKEHLTQAQLDELVETWLDQEIDVKGRTFKIRDVYLFAMNDYRVAKMLATAVNKGFDAKQEKIRALV